jgi:carbonic anhydrase
VEANVQQTARTLREASPIIQAEIAEHQATIIQAVYRLATGEVAVLA